MTRFDFAVAGRPSSEHRHHRAREGAAVVAALAGAGAIVTLIFLMISTTAPAQAPGAWIAAALLVVVWLTGIWWRWDAPDGRDPHHERERRSF